MDQQITLSTVQNSFEKITSTNFEHEAQVYIFNHLEVLARRYPAQLPLLKYLRDQLVLRGNYLLADYNSLRIFIDSIISGSVENRVLSAAEEKLLLRYGYQITCEYPSLRSKISILAERLDNRPISDEEIRDYLQSCPDRVGILERHEDSTRNTYWKYSVSTYVKVRGDTYSSSFTISYRINSKTGDSDLKIVNHRKSQFREITDLNGNLTLDLSSQYEIYKRRFPTLPNPELPKRLRDKVLADWKLVAERSSNLPDVALAGLKLLISLASLDPFLKSKKWEFRAAQGVPAEFREYVGEIASLVL